MNYLFSYVLLFIIASSVDAFWHLVVWATPYKYTIAEMNGGASFSARGIPALLAQVVMMLAIYGLIFIAKPQTYLIAALIGLFAGLLAITVYGFTNYALFAKWDLTATLLEILWGPLFGAFLGIVTFWLQKKFGVL